ncbi:MAG TPA: DUF4450 domain-containing protein [Chitinophagaceae bacterium]
MILQFRIPQRFFLAISFFILFNQISVAQTSDTTWWHNKVRNIHYLPHGNDFVLANGKMRFNRALYGTNTAFRVEAGDLPEFAMYMPGMGGNFKFGLIAGDKSKWITNAKNIKAIYRPGSMLYEIRDSLLGKGVMKITILALADSEGMIIKTEFTNVPSNIELLWVYGGASGKKFSRDGDVGADPESSFYLQPNYCKDNIYTITNNSFSLLYGSGKVLSEEDRYGNKPAGNDVKTPVLEENNSQKQLLGIVPPSSSLHEVDAMKQNDPLELFQSKGSATPAISGNIKISNGEYYFLIQNSEFKKVNIVYEDLKNIFNNAEAARKKIAERIVVNTPDPFINTLGGALGMAADAIWEEPTYMHGAVAWRMRLPAWRGPYAADPLGWHDRARMHFSSYANSQVTTPESGPVVADTALHLSRQMEKMGTSVFSSGYISRSPNNNKVPHHYDMNLVYIDELLEHFNWTGDIEYVKKMWPVLQRHLAWEKRNFDADGDGLYDAYAAIWASDALQYSGGGVTHSSAYNYRANKMAAQIAKMIGEDAMPYQMEADKILNAMNSILWMPKEGHYAEYKDLLGNKLLHTSAALWTIYHAIDEKAADPFQAYQSLKYIDNNIPHIPVKANGLDKKDLYVLSTTNWEPYEWSLNNVVLAESQHTALANWQGQRPEEAYKIWESSLIESMYIGASPGGFQQLTFYDAIRGELYRDFADGIGISARALVEGLFGISPDALNNKLTIQPGWPLQWDHASLTIPDITIDFKRSAGSDVYTIVPSFQKEMNLKLLLRTKSAGIKSIMVNDKIVSWKNVDDAIGDPVIEINSAYQKKYEIKIVWEEKQHDKVEMKKFYLKANEFSIQFSNAVVQKIFDPQNILMNSEIINNSLQGFILSDTGAHTVFVKLKQNGFVWWKPLDILAKNKIEIISEQPLQNNEIRFSIKNNGTDDEDCVIRINSGNDTFINRMSVRALSNSNVISVPAENLYPGTNKVNFSWGELPHGFRYVAQSSYQNIINWNVSSKNLKLEEIDLTKFFNDKVTQIFKNQYLSPRPNVPTLQLPTQGIGEWTHPLITANIDDIGLRKLAGEKNEITLPQGISFQTPSDISKSNIIFTSQWDNYPKQVVIPLSGKASHVYLLMAGATNPMQSRITNGVVFINYTDGTSDSLLLKNPETWWPIEQDYLEDGYAFHNSAAKPIRIHLKTGEITSTLDNSINKYNGKMIDGGAATVLDMMLDGNKNLKDITLHTRANDVVIGLMSVSLVRL